MQTSTVKKLLKYIKKYWFYLIASLILAFVTVVLTLYIPKLTGNTVDYMIDKGQVDLNKILELLSRMAICVAIIGAGQWIMNICNNKMTYSVLRDIRNDAFNKIETLPLSYIDSHPYGEIESKIISDTEQLSDGLLMGFTQLFSGVVTILGTLVFMIIINVKITIAVVCITPLSFLVAGFISKRTYSMFKKQSETRGEQTGFINEMIEGQRVVKAFNEQENVLNRFDEINERLNKYSLKAIFYSSTTNPSTRFVNSLVYASVAIVGALSIIGGQALTVGQLSAFLSYANQYTKPFNEISGVITELQNALACAARVFAFIEENDEIPDSEDAYKADSFEGNVGIDNISFSYVPQQKLIENFSLDVKKGQKVAIVGPTGCGKTTFINLLMRFYDVTKGAITVDGMDIRDIKRSSLRDSYGMVLQ